MQEVCPGCKEDLTYVVRGTQYSKATSVEIRGVYDGGLFYAHTRQSGGCGAAWHRWPKSHDLFYRAAPYVTEWNERNRAAGEYTPPQVAPGE